MAPTAQPPRPSTLLERSVELSQVERALLGASRGAGRLFVIEGEAGIGKSTLVAAASSMAQRAGLRVLRTRVSELERNYPYGAAVGLFDRLVEAAPVGNRHLFAGPARSARALFAPAANEGGSRRDEMARPDGDAFATIHGLYWLTLNIAESGPLLIAVDDAQWSDDGSLRFLHYLGQRVGELPIVLLLAFRTGPFADAELPRSIRVSPEATIIEPEPLSEAAVGMLLEAAGHPDASGRLRRSVWSTTRGNPLFIGEIIRGLGHEWKRGPSSRMDGQVPTTITRFVEGRLAILDPEAHRLAEAVAVLGEEATRARAARLAGMATERSSILIRRLVRGVVLDQSGPLDFVHPIVRTSVYESIPDVTRAHLHREAALLLADDGVALGVIGAQLLEAERASDPRVVDLLVAAADEAHDRGQPSVAVRLLDRALEEPPGPDRRSEILVALARAHARLRSPEAIERYREVVSRLDDPRQRAEVLLELGHVLIGASEWTAATEAFEQGMRDLATAHLGSDGHELHERLEAGFASAAWVSLGRHAEAEAVLRRMLDDGNWTRVNRELAAWASFQQSLALTEKATTLSRRMLDAIEGIAPQELITAGQFVEVAAGVLVTTDELDAEIALLTRSIAAAEQAGAYGKVGLYAYCRSFPFYYTGALTDAIADAQAAIRTAELGWETFMPAARAVLAFAHIERGELEAADEALRFDDAAWRERVDYGLLVPLARGRVAFARGNLDEAVSILEDASRLPRAMGLRALVPPNWREWMALSLNLLGRRDEARELATELVDAGRQYGARWSLAGALRVAGLVHGGDEGLELLRESASTLEASAARLERARALLDLGAALRRSGYARDARQTLGDALDLAHRIGARAFVERAYTELRAAGSRPRRFAVSGVDSLTPSERRVAMLGAEGRTNRQIAQALFVTPKAVEYHLGNVYPKLGIKSRRELARALRDKTGG